MEISPIQMYNCFICLSIKNKGTIINNSQIHETI